MEEKRSKITTLIVLTVFCVFAVCILVVLLTGADVYRRLVDREQSHYDRRTAAQYVTTRLRPADAVGAVRVADFEGHSALIILEEIDGSFYETCIYCYEGYVRELFTIAGGDFAPEDGEKILEAEQLNFRLDRSTLTVEITPEDGTEEKLTLYLRSGEGDYYEE